MLTGSAGAVASLARVIWSGSVLESILMDAVEIEPSGRNANKSVSVKSANNWMICELMGNVAPESVSAMPSYRAAICC